MFKLNEESKLAIKNVHASKVVHESKLVLVLTEWSLSSPLLNVHVPFGAMYPSNGGNKRPLSTPTAGCALRLFLPAVGFGSRFRRQLDSSPLRQFIAMAEPPSPSDLVHRKNIADERQSQRLCTLSDAER